MRLVKKHRCPRLGTMRHSHHFLKEWSWKAIIYSPNRLKQQFLIFFSNILTSQESGKNNSMRWCSEWRYDIPVSFTWNQTSRGNKLARTWHGWERVWLWHIVFLQSGNNGALLHPPLSDDRQSFFLNELSAATTSIAWGGTGTWQQSTLKWTYSEVGKRTKDVYAYTYIIILPVYLCEIKQE